MSDMGKAVPRKLGTVDVVCRELSVSAIRQLLGDSSAQDITSAGLFEDLRLGDLPLFTNLTQSQIDEALPSQLEPVIEGCKEANPHFFGMLVRLEARLRSSGSES